MNEEEGKSYFFCEFRIILVCVNFCILVMISAFAHFCIEISTSSSDQITHNNVQIRAAGIWGSALNQLQMRPAQLLQLSSMQSTRPTNW